MEFLNWAAEVKLLSRYPLLRAQHTCRRLKSYRNLPSFANNESPGVLGSTWEPGIGDGVTVVSKLKIYWNHRRAFKLPRHERRKIGNWRKHKIGFLGTVSLQNISGVMGLTEFPLRTSARSNLRRLRFEFQYEAREQQNSAEKQGQGHESDNDTSPNMISSPVCNNEVGQTGPKETVAQGHPEQVDMSCTKDHENAELSPSQLLTNGEEAPQIADNDDARLKAKYWKKIRQFRWKSEEPKRKPEREDPGTRNELYEPISAPPTPKPRKQHEVKNAKKNKTGS